MVALIFYFLPVALLLSGFNGLRSECGELVSRRHLNRFTGKKGQCSKRARCMIKRFRWITIIFIALWVEPPHSIYEPTDTMGNKIADNVLEDFCGDII